jgi:peptidoglycan/LPS O-acetylase OafA/YrhL
VRYRSEIDGLRAVAVVPVILFHADFGRFSGGFVGVDVFFVLSGYLITSLILEECADGRFSIAKFYERRARRILPALYFVMICCVPVAMLLMLPGEFRDFARTLASVVFFASNFRLWLDTDYFSYDAHLNPLLHTWSLATEEQYYILFPLLMLALWRAGPRRMTAVIVLALLGSLALAELLWPIDAIATFYLLPTRAWELAMGALVAIYLFRRRDPPASDLGAWLGLAMIMASVAVFKPTVPFPGVYALVPTLGTVLVVLYARDGTLARRALSLRPVVFVGLISYSAYLWHQPLFAFARLGSVEPPAPGTMLALSALALALAALSWRFVEAPFRDRRRVGRPMVFAGSLGGGVALLAAAVAAPALMRPPSDYPPALRQLVVPLDERTDYVRAAYEQVRDDDFTSGGGRRLLVLGDSHSQDFVNMIRENRAFDGYQIAARYIPVECQLYIGDEDVSRFIEAQYQEYCESGPQPRELVELAHQADVVVLVASWRDWAADRLPETIRNLGLRADQDIVVVGRKGFRGREPRWLLTDEPASFPEVRGVQSEQYQSATAALRRAVPDEIFVDTHRIVCGQGWDCPLFTPAGRLISHDGGHLTRAGARYVGALLFQDPLLAPYAAHREARAPSSG